MGVRGCTTSSYDRCHGVRASRGSDCPRSRRRHSLVARTCGPLRWRRLAGRRARPAPRRRPASPYSLSACIPSFVESVGATRGEGHERVRKATRQSGRNDRARSGRYERPCVAGRDGSASAKHAQDTASATGIRAANVLAASGWAPLDAAARSGSEKHREDRWLHRDGLRSYRGSHLCRPPCRCQGANASRRAGFDHIGRSLGGRSSAVGVLGFRPDGPDHRDEIAGEMPIAGGLRRCTSSLACARGS